MLAVQGAVETSDVVAVAKEVAAEVATLPRKEPEVGACKDIEGHIIFTIGSGNKGKDCDMLHTSMEKLATYIGTKYGDEASQES
jgi:hypothetical protein